MLVTPENLHIKIKTPDWLTIRETVKLLKKPLELKSNPVKYIETS